MSEHQELRRSLQKAELRAKERGDGTSINLDIVDQEERKANERGFVLARKRRVNPTHFTQVINENIAYLDESQYLTGAEFGFILTLAPLLQMGTNAIVHPKSGQYCSVSDIAEKLQRSRPKTSSMISTLIQKGIMYEFVNVLELKHYGRQVTARPFFLSPEILCCGDKSRLEGGIVRLMIHSSILEKSGIRLPIKAVSLPNAKYGKLVTRKVYLELQKEERKKSNMLNKGEVPKGSVTKR